MSADTPTSTESGSETRDDLLRVSDLWSFFCDRTSADARKIDHGESSMPSVSTTLICGIVCGFFLAVGQHIIFYVTGILTLVQGLWLILGKVGNLKNSPQKITANIHNGQFPQELRESIIKRLRWWNYLIVPAEWTPNSRLFDMRNTLENRRNEIENELKYWNSEEGKRESEEIAQKKREADERKQEQAKKLRYLQTRGVHITALEDQNGKTEEPPALFSDPEALTKQILTGEQRSSHLTRIAGIRDQTVRLDQERVFIEAMLLKIKKVATLLDNINQLHPALETITADNLDNSVRQIIGILEQRRQLVNAINRIHPVDVINLVGYDINFLKNIAPQAENPE